MFYLLFFGVFFFISIFTFFVKILHVTLMHLVLEIFKKNTEPENS